jgi:hypothetical protein
MNDWRAVFAAAILCAANLLHTLSPFRGIPDELSVASTHARPHLQQAMRNAVLRCLTPVLTE